ncbi:MAG TPA: thioesterase family protein [Bryobacteraceae bacterium]|nr:thioesterase family protein [Bryobacteraceae bacterium]
MPQREPFRFQTRIRFIDTDASGRIHYTAMFRYFESAEIEFLRTLGVSYDASRGYNLPRVHVECDFLRVIGHDDLITIEVSLTKLGNSSIRFEFQTFKANELAAKGAVVIVCADRKTLRSVPIPGDLRAKLSAVLQEPPDLAGTGG